MPFTQHHVVWWWVEKRATLFPLGESRGFPWVLKVHWFQCALWATREKFWPQGWHFIYPHLPYYKILEALICLFLSSKSVFQVHVPISSVMTFWRTLIIGKLILLYYKFFLQCIVVSKSKHWDWWKTNGKKLTLFYSSELRWWDREERSNFSPTILLCISMISSQHVSKWVVASYDLEMKI